MSLLLLSRLRFVDVGDVDGAEVADVANVDATLGVFGSYWRCSCCCLS